MHLKGTFKTRVAYKPRIGLSEDLDLPIFGPEEQLLVRADGQAGVRASGNELVNSSDYAYITTRKMNRQDEIACTEDGYGFMPVKAVEPLRDVRGKIVAYVIYAGALGGG